MSFLEKRTLRFLMVLDARGMERAELGSRTGLAVEEIDTMIDHGGLPEPESRRRITEALGVSEEYLFGSEEEVEAFLNGGGHWQTVKTHLEKRDGTDGRGDEGG